MVSVLYDSFTYRTTPVQSTLLMPSICGLCGSSSVSHLAWCLRWIAAHSLVIIPVVSHSQRRKKWLTIGMQVERAVRLAAVQEDRDAGDRDLHEHEADEEIAPPGKIQEASEHVWLCAFIVEPGRGATALILG